MSNNKIGIGYITCNAPDRVIQTLPHIPDVDEMVIVNDGEASCIPSNLLKNKELIQHAKNCGVGVSKNDALHYLMEKDCDHLFLIEDDVIVKNPNVFVEYIKTAEESGIWHLNYALQGPGNRKQKDTYKYATVNDVYLMDHESEPTPRVIKKYDKKRVALYFNLCGSFSYYYRGVIKAVGYLDERYKNAFEHVDHTLKVIQKGLHPPFWWFADISNPEEYLTDVKDCCNNSVIRKNEQFIQNLKFSSQYFAQKNGMDPGAIPDTNEQVVLHEINRIERSYARKVL